MTVCVLRLAGTTKNGTPTQSGIPPGGRPRRVVDVVPFTFGRYSFLPTIRKWTEIDITVVVVG